MKKGLIIATVLSAFAVLVGGTFVFSTRDTATMQTTTQQAMNAAADVKEVEIVQSLMTTKPVTTATTRPTLASTTTTTTVETVAPAIPVAESEAVEEALTTEAPVVPVVESEAVEEVLTTEAPVMEEVSTTTMTTTAELSLGWAPLPSEAQMMAEEIASQMSEKLGSDECSVPPTWNAWQRGLMFSAIYDDYSFDCTENEARYDWGLIQNPNGWKVSMCTALTDSVVGLPENFMVPSEVEDYSQFVFDVASTGLDENNLGCYVLMEKDDASVRYFFNGSNMSVSVKLGEESGYAAKTVHMPSGYIAIMHTQYEESEVFDEYIGSAIWCYRVFGACDYRLVEVLEEIPNLGCVVRQ